MATISSNQKSRANVSNLRMMIYAITEVTEVTIATGPQGHWRPNMSLPHARRPCRQNLMVSPTEITSPKLRVLAPVHLTPRPSLGNGLSTRTLQWRGSVAPYRRDTAFVHKSLIRDVLCRWQGLTPHAHSVVDSVVACCWR